MCGICGFISDTEISKNILIDMCNKMIHRGPDDEGQILLADRGSFIGFGHRRLSIIDLSKLGHQPMCSEDGRISLVFNGEIYNYLELKRKLNYEFKTSTDTEVLIATYLEYGIECVKLFNGMFAFALYDKLEHRLFLATDRFGKKPLYYSLNGNNIAFASTITALMEYEGISSELNFVALKEYMVKGYIHYPNTIYQNIKKLGPGEIITISNKQYSQYKYYDILEESSAIMGSFKGNYNDALDLLDTSLKKSIEYRLQADVKKGVLLSGGYDSSLIAAISNSVSENAIDTFTIGFEDELYNEAEYAKAVASHIGSNHHELYITEKDLYKEFDKILCAYDEPFADNSQIAMMAVSKLVKDSGVKVILSGDAGDELFCGYPIYKDMRLVQLLDPFGDIFFSVCGKKISSALPFYVKAIVNNRDNRYKTQFNLLGYVDYVDKIIPNKFQYIDETCIKRKSYVERRMVFDMDTFLVNDNLHKVDRATMYYSVEARNPFLDKEFTQLALSLPLKYKYELGIQKKILKDLVYRYIPKQLMDRPKRGFVVPIEKWLKNSLRDELMEYSRASYLRKQGIFNPSETERLVDLWINNNSNKRGQNYKQIIWAFFIFQMWYIKNSY